MFTFFRTSFYKCLNHILNNWHKRMYFNSVFHSFVFRYGDMRVMMGCEIFSMWQNLGKVLNNIWKFHSSLSLSYMRDESFHLVVQESTSWTSSQRWLARSWRWRWCLSRTWGTWWSPSFTTWWTGSSAGAATSNRSHSAPFWSLMGHAAIWL